MATVYRADERERDPATPPTAEEQVYLQHCVGCHGPNRQRDEKIRAFDQETGKELWSAQLPLGGYAPPSIYEANGGRFVVVATSGGGKVGTKMGDAYVAFALPVR